MNVKNQTQDRQQILIDLYKQYLLSEITLGQLLSYLRKNVLGLSQEQYATLVGISRRTLTDIEQDKGKLTQSVLDKVFKPLGLKAGLVPTHGHIVDKIIKPSE
ncbi:XRE family transcriptional regulator [Acinetobacter lactucae]|uniref:Helix-turn-helix transcriptional regulator n=1 Tax=Acinetobacter lactucae TaxID=1785128 RepID=A0ABS1AK63_9GAMM|nr:MULTISPECIES: helix-turn-helix transcriptional regulator [Acinetobacter calcoaceticus/baumannii complex]ETR94798.1 helix-turn-helix family protein [Acinetobacter lactucae]KYQ80096.1 XRE family transcriptional regulator [Acinetobacter lactucae]MBJ8437801.1 helix-turn-helix transcriptional regulator [Acinetobacter lactucae]QXA08986.1 helix-turn-helix domain-containing protein [Acinetobacter pittii]